MIEYEEGTTATCSRCGEQATYNGLYWEHNGGRYKHEFVIMPETIAAPEKQFPEGTTAMCDCGHSAKFNGDYWLHVHISPRHLPLIVQSTIVKPQVIMGEA